ncbi:STN domain-containing protein [Pigmentiphaga kullae]|uniref:Secretin/TonB-like protein n=1 Tax=Pigmentiphaga kullae TaxID=151784 RepID=A0A4Q7NMY6_9BURK|nr:STN domain-containing protein [Pigmentiphaga kullae]RZS86493.1 secretin/TonB-like protein [Pigmentiphaga kullae]
MTCQVIPLRPRRAKRRTFNVPGKSLLVAVPVALSIGWLLALPGMPHAQAGPTASAEHRQDFAISSGDLRPALEKYARQAGIRLSFDPALVAGLTTPGLTGRYTIQDGLDTLLRGTGYTAAQEGGRYVLIPEPPASAGKRPPSGPRLVGALTPV